MPVVVVIHIAYAREHRPTKDTPNRETQFGLQRHHDIVAKHIAVHTAQTILSAQARKHGV